MSNKKLNLVQVNFEQGPKEFNAFYLPYTAASIWSYASSIQSIRDTWNLEEILWKRSPIDQIYKKLADSDIVAFSSYIWNKNYNYTLASKIKKYNPNILIVFGGPDLPIQDTSVFKKYPFIDIIVKNEGEISFSEILKIKNIDDIRNIKGLLINDQGKSLDTGSNVRIENLDIILSPYGSGIFDNIINDYPTVVWNATLETNRGCPYQCTFCDWGSLTYSKVKKFNLDRVFADIEWIGKNKCDWMSITDANFGMFVERDELIVDKIIDTQYEYGYPRRIGLSWAKNQKSTVVHLAKKLTKHGFNNGLTLSVQSLDDHVLDVIKRKNLETNKLNEIFDLCNKENVTVNTELILGLPGETVESWKNNVWHLLKINQHNGIEFFQAQLLENAEMNTKQKHEYNIKTITVYDYLSGTNNVDDIPEGVDVVVSTNNISFEQMLECQKFQWYINTWHVNGLSQWYSRFLYKYSNVQYDEFYQGLLNYISNIKWWQNEEEIITDAYQRWMTLGKINMDPIGHVNIHGWNLIHLTNLKMHANSLYELYHDAVFSYVKHQYSDLISEPIIKDLKKISESYVIDYSKIKSYPFEISVNTNIVSYVLGDNLKKNTHRYTFEFVEDVNMDISVFLQNIYYARRRNFGKAKISLKTV